jgi:hypothetical protein
MPREFNAERTRTVALRSMTFASPLPHQGCSMNTYRRGEVTWVKLGEMDPVERALFSAWLGGLPRPLEKEDCAYLFDYLSFRSQQQKRKAVPSKN